MNELYDLREMMVEQLLDYGKKGELSSSVLEKVDTLAHATKNLDKVIEVCEEEDGEEYSGRRSRRSYGRSMHDGRVYRRSRRSGRYSGDGYSRHGDLADRLYAMAEDAPDDKMKEEFERLASRMEQM